MLNKVILLGHVGADPDVRTLESGSKVARVRMATTERIFNRQSQEAREHTEWHTVVLWRGLADVVDKYVRKGSQIYVEGPLRSTEWTDKQGQKHFGVEIVASEMKLLGGGPRRNDAGSGSMSSNSGSSGGGNYGGGDFGGDGGDFSTPSAPAASAPAPRKQAAPSHEVSSPPPPPMPAGGDPDDLPF
jgi:single-strand DNA-binding protein